MGMPYATSKFMALYLGRGEGGLARGVFKYAFRTQAILACSITLSGITLVLCFGDPKHRDVSILQVAVILPIMLTQIPTWANMASEQMRKNIPGGLIADAIYIAFVWLSLALDWNLAGVAIGMLLA